MNIISVTNYIPKRNIHFAFKQASEEFPQDPMIVTVNGHSILMIPKLMLNQFEYKWNVTVLDERLTGSWGADGWGINTDSAATHNAMGHLYSGYEDCCCNHRGHIIWGELTEEVRAKIIAEINEMKIYLEKVEVKIDLLNDGDNE